MKPWTKRPIEEANLLNPAFCCISLSSSMVGYKDINGTGMPYPLAFMVLPIVLHKATRESLPRGTRTSMVTWLQEHTEAKLQFIDRVIALRPHTREALLFGSAHGWLVLQGEGVLQTMLTDTDADRFVRQLNDEARECARRARFVGKWLASAGTTQTVMTLWGIRP